MKRIIGKFAFFSFVLTLASHNNTYAQKINQTPKAKESITFYYRFDKDLLDSTYMTNKTELLKLKQLMQDHQILAGIDSLVVAAYASPEGNPIYNEQLAARRAESVKTYLLATYPRVAQYPLQIRSLGENWEGLKERVLADTRLPGRSQVLLILNQSIGSIEKEEQLRAVLNGASWHYIERNLLRFLRGSSCLMFYLDPAKMAAADTVKSATPLVPVASVWEVPAETPPVFNEETLLSSRLVRPVALKTNLLFDAATLLNVEVEVPVAPRFSIAGEWIFPWWLWENKQNCLEVLSGNLEARYWFKPNYAKQDPALGRHNPLSGWFVGLYGGGGLYDLERKREGYQGEFFIATGLSGGYVLPLKRNLSMEFSLGLGILRTKYRHYHAEFCEKHADWHLIRQNSGQYTWVGPTRAKVSLVWYPHLKLKKKGGNR